MVDLGLKATVGSDSVGNTAVLLPEVVLVRR